LRFERDGYFVSTDPALLQIDFIHGALGRTYWAGQRSRETVEESIRRSVCFGLYEEASGRQVGFARIVTDGVTFSWVCDVVVDEGCRGRGLGKWMFSCVASHPSVEGVLTLLATRDAHDLYQQFGFVRFEAMRRPKASWQ
jgi:N-acetylglutamate synthase-like GNAT family acetyltransferase